MGDYTKTAHRQNGPTKTAPKILMPKKLSKTAHHTTKTAHSKVQNGPQQHPKRPVVIIGIWQRPKRR